MLSCFRNELNTEFKVKSFTVNAQDVCGDAHINDYCPITLLLPFVRLDYS